ncbi:MAG: hypothetical protein JWQ89_2332 [Devosia sp.]|nr:hypothetical protein [Devosia sp.]
MLCKSCLALGRVRGLGAAHIDPGGQCRSGSQLLRFSGGRSGGIRSRRRIYQIGGPYSAQVRLAERGQRQHAACALSKRTERWSGLCAFPRRCAPAARWSKALGGAAGRLSRSLLGARSPRLGNSSAHGHKSRRSNHHTGPGGVHRLEAFSATIGAQLGWAFPTDLQPRRWLRERRAMGSQPGTAGTRKRDLAGPPCACLSSVSNALERGD